jgi:hypothetical protein
MANPGSKGVGSGTAVIDDYSRLNQVTDNIFANLREDQKANKKQKALDDAKKEKALGELRGDFGEFDTSKMRESDKETAVKMNEDGYKAFEGNWDKVLNGDPYWSNLYREHMNKQKIFISNSVESKTEMKELYSALNEPGSGYTTEKRKAMEDYMLATGSTMKDMKDKGLYAQDQVVGDPLGRMDEAFVAAGNVLYEKKKGSYINKDKEQVSYDKKVWQPDSEALPIFKATVSANPRIMNDLEIKYPGVEFDEQVQRFYDEYKTSRETNFNNVSVGRAPEDTSSNGGWGDKRDKYDFGLSMEELRSRGGKSEDAEIITIGKKNASQLSPITVKGVVGTVSEIRKTHKGEWVVVRNVMKDDLSGGMTVTGETVNDPLDKTMKAHLESEYGITDIDSFSKELKARKSGNNSESKSVIKGF